MPVILGGSSNSITAQSIIEQAMRKIGALAAGESAETSELDDGLESLNGLLDSWRNDKLMCYAMQNELLSLVSGTSSYTVGPGGDLVTTRPVVVERAYVTVSDASYPVEILTEAKYAAIPDKAATSDWPDRILVRGTAGDATILTYPVPSASSTLVLVTRVPLTGFEEVTDTVTMPPGWSRALVFNLAVEIAPEYETEAPPSVIAIATSSKAAIKRVNQQKVLLNTGLNALLGQYRGNIISGQP